MIDNVQPPPVGHPIRCIWLQRSYHIRTATVKDILTKIPRLQYLSLNSSDITPREMAHILSFCSKHNIAYIE
jgi:hypothetical protein